MPIDWSQPLQTRHDRPREVIVFEDDGVASTLGKRRGFVVGTGVKVGEKIGTVYLYDENGRCNCSGKDSPFDLVNVADTLARAA